jgi:hypothetical protein
MVDVSKLRRAGVVARALAAQARGPAPPRVEPLELAPCAAALERAGAQVAAVRVGARARPWTTSGLRAVAGAPLTWLAHGDTWIFSQRGTHVPAALQLRVRTGGRAPALSGTGPTHTAPAPHDGEVELCCLYPDELQGPDEQLVGDLLPRRAFGGGFDVAVAVWAPGTDVGAALAAAADPTGLCAREAERLAHPLAPPEGWHAHPVLALTGLHAAGDAEIAVEDPGGGVEIIRRDARVPLTPTLALRWRWRLDTLPSPLAEDTLLTHDYLSVAVEFDDGKDLTYYWSSSLPPETSYRCPLPHWRHREWHLVVCSGRDRLGTWQAEQRTIAPDRDRAIGGRAPREVTRVWLIATTVAQRGRASGRYAEVALVDGDALTQVL